MNPEYTGVGIYITTGRGEALLNLREVGPNIKWSGLWTIFGGRRDPHESDPVQTAVRELREELGLGVRPEQLLPFTPRTDMPDQDNRLFHLRWDGDLADLVLGEGQDMRLVRLDELERWGVPEHVVRNFGQLRESVPRERGLVSTASGGLVVRGDGRVLLIRHRRSGWWLPPGGRGEQGEAPARTAAREVEEETGITGVADRLLLLGFLTDKAALFPAAVRQPRAYPCHLTLFHIAVEDPDAIQVRLAEDEVTDARWWDVAEVITATDPRLIDQANAEMLRLAYAAYLNPAAGPAYLEW